MVVLVAHKCAVAIIGVAWLVLLGITAQEDLRFAGGQDLKGDLTLAGTHFDDVSQEQNNLQKPTPKKPLFLMGTSPQKNTTPVIVAPLVETKLDLSLKGIFSSSDSQLGGAIIDGGSTNQPSYYQVGDVIVADATLVDVHQNSVIIDRAGKREKLSFDNDVLRINTFNRVRNSNAAVNSPLASATFEEATVSTPIEQVSFSTSAGAANTQTLQQRLKKLRSE